ncbi:hypothetical protein ACFFMP_15145 [Pseudoroseomonas cervicalis]
MPWVISPTGVQTVPATSSWLGTYWRNCWISGSRCSVPTTRTTASQARPPSSSSGATHSATSSTKVSAKLTTAQTVSRSARQSGEGPSASSSSSWWEGA